MMLCVVCIVHEETRSVGFLVEPRNKGQQFVSGLTSKPLGQFVSGLASKLLGRFVSGLGSKPLGRFLNGLASKPLGQFVSGLASKLSYPVFMPKLSTHRMHDPGSIVPHIRPKVLTDNQMS
jgi:hypothetical protein